MTLNPGPSAPAALSNPQSKNENPFEKFRMLVRRILLVPKSEIDRRDAEWRQSKTPIRNHKRPADDGPRGSAD